LTTKTRLNPNHTQEREGNQMKINEIPQELIKLHTAQNEKMGKLCAPPYFYIRAADQSAFSVSFWDCPATTSSSGLKQINDDTAEEVFTAAWKYINDLPSVAEQQLSDFQCDLSKLIDKGRDFNIDLDIVNPLIATSQKLAENAIEDKTTLKG